MLGVNIPDIVRVAPQLCQVVTDVADGHILRINLFSIHELRLQELWNVDDGGDDDDRYDVHEDPGGDAPPSEGLSVVEGMTDGSVPEH